MPGGPHLKVTLSGLFENSSAAEVEIFAMTMAFAQGLPGAYLPFSQAQLNELNNATVSVPFTNWFSSSAAAINSKCVMTQVKYAAIGADGKYPANVNATLFDVETPGGQASSIHYPSTTSYVVGLRTNVRGSKGRGRFYVPGSQLDIASDWKFAASELQGAADAAGTMLKGAAAAINTALGGAGANVVTAVVASSVVGPIQVQKVELGNVPANVSRRKNALVEAFTTTTSFP